MKPTCRARHARELRRRQSWRDLVPGHGDAARAGHVEAAEQVQQRGLAGAARAHEGHEVALVDVEVHALQDVQLLAAAPVRLGEVAHHDERPRLTVPADLDHDRPFYPRAADRQTPARPRQGYGRRPAEVPRQVDPLPATGVTSRRGSSPRMKTSTGLSPARARALLKKMRGRRVIVLGDVMLDEFLWGTCARISPEAPVPVVEVTRQSYHLGGAGNVAANVCALGGTAVLAGVVGADAAAERIRESLAAAGVQAALVASDSGRPTTIKTRIVAQNQQIVRADRERSDDITAALEDGLVGRLRGALPSCGALVVSDYQKGVVTPRLMKAVVSLARRRGIPVLVDPKVRHFALYRGVALVTPNQLETEQATGIRIRNEDDLLAAGARILRKLRCGAALVTRGRAGHEPVRGGPPAAAHPDLGPGGLRRDGGRRFRDRHRGPGRLRRGAPERGRHARQLRGGRGGGQAGDGHGHPRRGGGRGRGRGRRRVVKVAVVGAGPAGSLLAHHLARDGAAVTVFDASHPREKPCGGGLTGQGPGACSRRRPTDDPLPVPLGRGVPVRVRVRRGRRPDASASPWRWARAARWTRGCCAARPRRARATWPSAWWRWTPRAACAPRPAVRARFDVVVGADGAGSLVRRTFLAPTPAGAADHGRGLVRARHRRPWSCASRPASPATCGSSRAATTSASASARRSAAMPTRAMLGPAGGGGRALVPRLRRSRRASGTRHTIPSPSADPRSILEIGGRALGAGGRRGGAGRPHHRRGDLLRAALGRGAGRDAARGTARPTRYPERRPRGLRPRPAEGGGSPRPLLRAGLRRAA